LRCFRIFITLKIVDSDHQRADTPRNERTRGNTMRRNEAYNVIPREQIDENPMEARVARIESDVASIQNGLARIELDIRKLRDGQVAANDAIAQVNVAVAVVDGKVNTLGAKVDALDAKVDAKINALEAKMIKWMIGTVIAGGSLAFSFARFVH
jgi:hypothetical protein